MARQSGRTSNGRSSIYLGEDGRWHGWVTMGVKENGKPDRRHRTGQSEAVVTAKVRALEAQRDAGTVPKTGKALTVEAWMVLWITTIAPRSVEQSTLDSTYRPKVMNWIVPRLGRHRLDRLQPEHLDAFYIWLGQQGLSKNTIVQIHRILSRALKIAVRRGAVGRNVAALVDAPSGEEVEIEPLSREEARRVLGVADARRNGARWSVGLALGLRQCEVLGMRWEYIDLDARQMHVWWQIKRTRFSHGCEDPRTCGTRYHRAGCADNCTKHTKCPPACTPTCTAHARECPDRVGGGWHFARRKGKGKRGGNLTLTLPPALVQRLRTHKAAQSREKLAAGDRWTDLDLVFAGPTGQPIEPHTDWEEWRDLLQEVGIAHVRVHDGRHTAATLLVEQGAGAEVVQEVLGLSSITIARRYMHISSSLAAKATDRVGTALWG
ncbi:tyrosine-type recombinase/integrase [Embleya sp. NPDC127516]|uniref:tyrosine-type recombinase/integrase n=1 Tax=Embleya sp. NPDC127516 TaxID=3363990 RepID=UPI003805F918